MLNFSKKIIAITLCLISSLALAYTTEIPLTSCDDLQNIQDMSGNYYLTNDIDCEKERANPFNPIAFEEAPHFLGTLDGNGFTIWNLRVRNEDDEKLKHTGIFRILGEGSNITNVNFSGCNVGARDEVDRGLIAGRSEGRSEISNVNVTGLKIYRAYIDSGNDQKDHGASGGIVGKVLGVLSLTDVHVHQAAITKNAFAGGLVGAAQGRVSISRSTVVGLTTPGSKTCMNGDSECGAGGLVGLIGDLNESPGTSPKLQEDYAVQIIQSFAKGSISTEKNMGGLVGLIKLDRSVLIQNSYAMVNLSCERTGLSHPCKYAGGLIGQAKQGEGQQPISLENVYAAGRVELDAEKQGRGIVGHNSPEGSTRIQNSESTQSYFDKTATQKKSSGDKVSIRMTPIEMQVAAPGATQKDHFFGWDPTIWSFNYGHYPSLTGVHP